MDLVNHQEGESKTAWRRWNSYTRMDPREIGVKVGICSHSVQDKDYWNTFLIHY
jgi:hypothetical protein